MQIETLIVDIIVKKLILIPVSSAVAERNQSHFGFIHNFNRNRLTNEHIFKLVSVYSYYRILKNPKIIQKEIEIDIQNDNTLDLDFIVIDDDSDDNVGSNKTDSEVDEYEE